MRAPRLAARVAASVLVAFALVLAGHPGPVPLPVPAQETPPDRDAAPVLSIEGAAPAPVKVSGADLAAMPRTKVEAEDKEGAKVTYEGVALAHLLAKAQVPSGHGLRGEWVSRYLLVEADDGYKAVFALPELDPAFSDRVVILADTKDGKPLPANEAPFRIVIPAERLHSRWVRQVRTLRVVRQP